MDDSGYFSVQVIANALSCWNLDLIPFKSQNPIAQLARAEPTTQKSYICNYHDHWFTVRKVGQQWFNLNSLLSGPELISDTYLSLFLHQLETEGYSIFIVNGILPACQSDQLLSTMKVEQKMKPRLLRDTEQSTSDAKSDKMTAQNADDESIQAAILASLETNADDERRQMEAAIALSLQNNDETS